MRKGKRDRRVSAEERGLPLFWQALYTTTLKTWFGPAVLAVIFLLLLAGLRGLIQQRHLEYRRLNLQHDLQAAHEAVRSRLNANRDYLLLLAQEMAFGRLDEPGFQARVSQYVADNPELINVTWADADFIIRWTAPYEPNKQVIGLSLSLPEPQRASRLARETRRPAYTTHFWVIQGKPAFEVYVPVFRGKEFLGTFGGIYACDRVLRYTIPPRILDEHHARLEGPTGTVVAELPLERGVDRRLVQRLVLSPPGHEIWLRLATYGEPFWQGAMTLLTLMCVALVIGMAWGMWRLQHDLTSRRQVEAELQESEERFRTLFENAPDAIFLADTVSGEILDANLAASELLGRRRGEIVSMHQAQLHPSRLTEESKGVFRDYIQQLQRGEPVTPVEWFIERADGTERPVEIRAQTTILQGKPVVQGFFRDITRRKQAEAQMEAALKEKEVLLREIHHRVKNNLQVISSLLDLQARYARDPAVRTMFNDSRERVKTLALMHEQLYQSPDMARLDLAAHIHSLVRRLRHLYDASERGVRLQVDVTTVFLDLQAAIACGLLLNELVTNALKHAFPDGSGGEVRVHMRAEEDEQVTLSVADNGIGLPPEIDLHNAESLGLRLVQMLVRQLKGTISVQRQKGTAVRVTFPR